MANQNNAKCAICGEPYYLCLPCDKKKGILHWKIHTDTPEHYKIYQIIHGYSCGVYTKEEAKEKFQNVDLSGYENFKEESVVNAINEILDTKKKLGKTKSKKEKSVNNIG